MFGFLFSLLTGRGSSIGRGRCGVRRGGAVELLFCKCMWLSGGVRALDGDAAGDPRGAAVELLFCNSMWPRGGNEHWMRTLQMTTWCCCGAAVLQL